MPDFGGAVVHPDVVSVIEDAAADLIEAAGLKRIDLDFTLPDMGAAWIARRPADHVAGAGAFWPDIRDMVTTEVAGALDLAAGYDIAMAAAIDPVRKQLNETVATLFEQVDIVARRDLSGRRVRRGGPVTDASRRVSRSIRSTPAG